MVLDHGRDRANYAQSKLFLMYHKIAREELCNVFPNRKLKMNPSLYIICKNCDATATDSSKPRFLVWKAAQKMATPRIMAMRSGARCGQPICASAHCLALDIAPLDYNSLDFSFRFSVATKFIHTTKDFTKSAVLYYNESFGNDRGGVVGSSCERAVRDGNYSTREPPQMVVD